MGQSVSDQCSCNDGFLGMCTPEDPNKEAASTLQASPQPAYPMPTLSERGSPPAPPSPMRQGGGGWGSSSEEQIGFIAPPPEDGGMYGAPPPTGSGFSPAPAPQGASPDRRDVSADDILSNIEGSEEVLYSEAFASFPGGLNGSVGLDSAAMRDFLCTNSSITMDDVDMELLKVANEEMCLPTHGFLHLLREFSISEGDSISQFMGLSHDGESLSAEECRSGLLLFAQQKLHVTNFGDERWECIFNTVMWDAGVSVSMEQWLGYSKLTGRLVRLLRYAQL